VREASNVLFITNRIRGEERARRKNMRAVHKSSARRPGHRCGRVAQLAEQCPFKAWVDGSSPSALTTQLVAFAPRVFARYLLHLVTSAIVLKSCNFAILSNNRVFYMTFASASEFIIYEENFPKTHKDRWQCNCPMSSDDGKERQCPYSRAVLPDRRRTGPGKISQAC
jgi:hypothetical protein